MGRLLGRFYRALPTAAQWELLAEGIRFPFILTGVSLFLITNLSIFTKRGGLWPWLFLFVGAGWLTAELYLYLRRLQRAVKAGDR